MSSSYIKGRVLCPFHFETEESLTIYSDGHYYCFGCGAYGKDVEDLHGMIKQAPNFRERSKNRVAAVSRVRQQYEQDTSLDESAIRFHEQLGDRRNYFLSRGLSNKIIDKYLLGWSGTRYTIPALKRGKVASIKFRRDDENKEDMGPRYINTMESQGVLYNGDILLDPQNKAVFYTEGEMDCLTLVEMGFPAVSSTTGVNGFSESWLFLLERLDKVVLVFDNDAAGRVAAGNMQDILSNLVVFEDMPEKFKDVNEYYLGDRNMCFLKLFMAVTKCA